MELQIVDGKLVQVRKPASYQEQTTAERGRLHVNRGGGYIEPRENYGATEVVHRDSDGFRSTIKPNRHVVQIGFADDDC